MFLLSDTKLKWVNQSKTSGTDYHIYPKQLDNLIPDYTFEHFIPYFA